MSGPAPRKLTVGVIDVGSPRSGKLGWAIVPPDGVARRGSDLDAFIDQMAALAGEGPAAIGFEAPLFIPTRKAALDILTARLGEGARPWSGGAGATVTTIALAVMAYSLAALRPRLPTAVASVDFLRPPTLRGEVLFFEAFVSSTAKGDDHAQDALIAAEEARRLFDADEPFRSAIDEPAAFSLLGASLLHAGWSTDLSLLSAPCLVVKPGFNHPRTRSHVASR